MNVIQCHFIIGDDAIIFGLIGHVDIKWTDIPGRVKHMQQIGIFHYFFIFTWFVFLISIYMQMS